MQLADDANNYDEFVQDWADYVIKRFSKKEFNRQRNEYYPLLGRHTKLEPAYIHRNPTNIVVQWKMHCEKTVEPVLLVNVFTEINGEIKIHACTFFN